MTPTPNPDPTANDARDPDAATGAPMPAAPSTSSPAFDRVERDPDEGPGRSGGSGLQDDDDAADEEVGGGD